MTKARVNADNASADIQGITAGTGLTGGGTSGTVTLTNDMATAIAAKGDLVVGTGNDTYAALTAGEQGSTLVADSAATSGLRWQQAKTGNVIINGNFDIWQRGTSFNIGTDGSAFTADRWKGSYTGTSINNVATQQTDVPNPNSEFSLRFTQTGSNATSVTEFCARQFIEQYNILPLLGKNCVLSFWYKSNKTGSHGIRINGTQNTGGTSQATTFTVLSANTWEFKTINVTAFSAVSAASASVTALGGFVDIGFRVENNGFTSVSQNDYFQISQMQLEVGSVATAFIRSGGTIQGELAACQRYYWRIDNSSLLYKIYGMGTANSTTVATIPVPFPVRMRVVPTTLEYSTLWLYDGNSGWNITSLVQGTFDSTELCGSLRATVASGLTQFRPYILSGANSGSAFLAFGAEL